MACELHHECAGDAAAPPVVLGGSLGTTLAMWRRQRETLSERFRVIAFDHRGHGGSPCPPGPYAIDDLGGDVIALLDRLELERVSYCGLSLGGMVGMWLAAHAPQRIDRLVLICTASHLPLGAAYGERAASVRAAGSTDGIADAVVDRWFTPGYAQRHADVVGRHRSMIASIPAEGYAGCCEAIAALDLRTALAAIAAPTLVIAGAQDAATPPDLARVISDSVPGARLEVLDPAAHLANVERADAVSSLIADHLDPREEP